MVKFIGKEIFSFCFELKSIEIQDGIRTIGYAAFRACLDVEKISLPCSVTSISGEAFQCVADVYCYAETPPLAKDNSFFYAIDCTLHVPSNVVELYKSTKPWSSFKAIVGIE